MTKDEALDLALEALEALGASCLIVRDDMLADKIQQAITALREELAQPENGEKCHDCGGMGYQDGIGDRCPTCNGFGQQPEQEPVAWMRQDGQRVTTASDRHNYSDYETRYSIPLYTAPPQRTWVGLTDEERITLFEKYGHRTGVLVGAVEDKLKEKNT